MASSTVVLTIGVMIIGAAISESGLASTVGKWIIKISKGSEIKLIVGTYLVSALMSRFFDEFGGFGSFHSPLSWDCLRPARSKGGT